MVCFSYVSVNILFEGQTNNNNNNNNSVCRDSSVGIVTRQGLEVRGIVGRFPGGARDLCPPQVLSLYNPLSLLFSGYGEHSANGKAGRDVELTTHPF